MSETIAHFHKGPVVRTALTLSAVVLLLLFAILYTPDGHILAHVRSPGPLMYPIGLFGFAGCTWVLYICFSVIEKVLLENGKALWVSRGKIIYVSRVLLSANLKDIAEITTGTYGRYDKPGIVLKMRSGRQKIFPSLPLIEPSEDIIARLREKLPRSCADD